MLINLFPWRHEEEKRKTRVFLGQCIATLSLTIFSCAIFYMCMQKSLVFQKIEIESLERIIYALPYGSDRNFIKYMTSPEGEKKINLLEEKISSDRLFFEVLKFLSIEIPSTIYLNKISKKRTAINLYGRAISQEDFASFVKFAEDNFTGREVLLGEVSQIENEEYKVEFMVSIVEMSVVSNR